MTSRSSIDSAAKKQKPLKPLPPKTSNVSEVGPLVERQPLSWQMKVAAVFLFGWTLFLAWIAFGK